MRYLIDGHNLIAQLPDIDLSDPDDEVKLVYKLRGFSIRTGKRVTVVFDGGIPGGVSQSLSTGRVTVHFAAAERSSADHILLGIINKVKNVRDYIVVSSDREIRDAAEKRGILSMTTERFKNELVHVSSPSDDSDDKDPNPKLTRDEIDEWLSIFGDDDTDE